MIARPGEFERYAVDCALDAAYYTELWIPQDPDYRFSDYFEAAAARNVSLLEGFEQLGEQAEERGILPDTDGAQTRFVTDGGRLQEAED